MKKEIKMLLVINLIFIIVLCIILFLNKNGIINKERQIIKEMSETTQVTDLNNQINSLNATHTEYANYIQACKTKIATALTNEGVTTSDQATLETMAENISKILQARTSDATATADNITEGYTAYISGELVTGTGADNNSYYNFGLNSNSGNFTLKKGTMFLDGQILPITSGEMALGYSSMTDGTIIFVPDDNMVSFTVGSNNRWYRAMLFYKDGTNSTTVQQTQMGSATITIDKTKEPLVALVVPMSYTGTVSNGGSITFNY